MTIDVNRDDLILSTISFSFITSRKKVYLYEIYNIQVEDLEYLSPTIVLQCRCGENIKIHYDTLNSSRDYIDFQSELNYFIQSVLED